MPKEDWEARNALSVECVAAYVRVSTQEQKLHGLSLDAQRMKLQEYAKEHNMKIVGWYVDEGVSGRKLIRRRPELQRMIQDAEKGLFTRIIMIKLDRFFRSVAEYHECMKRIAPVVWTTTEEKYDLSTAQGRMLVNMKLTIAEMEADQTGERIAIVNEYKASTGQPLVGTDSLPFGFRVGKDESTGRKNVIHDPDTEPIVYDIIEHYMTYQSRRKTIAYAYSKHHVTLTQKTLKHLFNNPMLHGEYRDNPNYCEPYIDKETHEKLIQLNNRNIKDNTKPDRTYIFSGLMVCPECGRVMGGNKHNSRKKSGKKYEYKKYRCTRYGTEGVCTYMKTPFENTVEKILLENIEKYLEEAKIVAAKVEASDEQRIYKYNVEEINGEIDRLNYSWRKGRIRSAEQYEREHDELLEKLRLAEAEQNNVAPQDFSKIEAVLHSGWKEIYAKLDDEHKQAFWRSFIVSFEPDWDTETKRIKNIKFF